MVCFGRIRNLCVHERNIRTLIGNPILRRRVRVTHSVVCQIIKVCIMSAFMFLKVAIARVMAVSDLLTSIICHFRLYRNHGVGFSRNRTMAVVSETNTKLLKTKFSALKTKPKFVRSLLYTKYTNRVVVDDIRVHRSQSVVENPRETVKYVRHEEVFVKRDSVALQLSETHKTTSIHLS